MKILQFPKQRPSSFQAQQARPLGLYLVLAFMLIYLLGMWWVQRFGIPHNSAPPSSAAKVAVTSP